MPWTDWKECRFDRNGRIDASSVRWAPNRPGVYAIATRTGWGYNVQYIGMSTVDLAGRLQKHFSKRGNRVIKALLEDKERGGRTTSMVESLYFAYCETSRDNARLVESLLLNGTQPIANLVGGRLPKGLTDQDLNRKTQRDD